MSREVRRVKPGWQPPIKCRKRIHSRMFAQGFEERWVWEVVAHFDKSLLDAQREWDAEKEQWDRGEHEDQPFLLAYHTKGDFFTTGKYPDISRHKVTDWEGPLPEDARMASPRPWVRYDDDSGLILEERWFVSMEDLIQYATYEREKGERPDDPTYYHPHWEPEEMTGYALYETVSEGTPVSPIFDTRPEFVTWLIAEMGMTAEGADAFADDGSVPSMMIIEKSGGGGILFTGEDLMRNGFPPA